METSQIRVITGRVDSYQQEGLTNPKVRHSQQVKNVLDKKLWFYESLKYRILTISCKFLQKMLVYIKQYTSLAILDYKWKFWICKF